MITPDERAAMRALADAAFPGPWTVIEDHVRVHGVGTNPDEKEASVFEDRRVGTADARFIAAARTAVPRLLDALDTAEAEVARLRRQHEMDLAMHEAYRPEVVAEVAVCLDDDTDWEVVAAWCGGTIHNVQNPSGEYTSYVTIPGVGEAWNGSWIVQRHDLSFDVRAEVAGPSEESVARLAARPAPVPDDSDALALLDEMNHEGRIEYADYSALHDAITAARPAPVWDEDTVTEAVASALADHRPDLDETAVFTGECDCGWRTPGPAWAASEEEHRPHVASAVLAVVREHLPVRPDRETVARTLYGRMRATTPGGAQMPEWDSESRQAVPWLGDADAVLALWG